MLGEKGVTTWLVAAVVALVLIFFAASRARSAAAPLVTKPAADAAVRGETEQAARLIERVLASDGTNAEALFVRACIRLQAGDFKAATEDTNRLESLRGRLPEVRMMRELAVARGQTPVPGWMPAFLAALKKIFVASAIRWGWIASSCLLKPSVSVSIRVTRTVRVPN